MRTDDDCESALWQEAYAFSLKPSPEKVAWAIGVLEAKLDRWDSQCKDTVEMILETVGEHKIDAGRPYLLRFLNVDLTLPRAEPLARTAARALGHYGGDEAFDALVQVPATASSGLRASAAIALGTLADRRSVPILERLVENPDSEVRDAALSSLAAYCSPSSRSTVLQALRDPDEHVRNSATWWLATCASVEDASLLRTQLEDVDELVRSNALKGLIRLRSEAACGKLSQLLADESLAVQAVARDYEAVCKAP